MERPTGMTNNLLRRIFEHKQGVIEGFAKKYGCKKLVYFEQTDDVRIAIQREKQIKWWRRDWKKDLIVKSNPDWKDLYYDIGGTDDLITDFSYLDN